MCYIIALAMIWLGGLMLLVQWVAGLFENFEPRQPKVSKWQEASPIGAHYRAHERGNWHVGVRAQAPVDFEQNMAFQHLVKEHANDPRVELPGCVRSVKNAPRGAQERRGSG